MSFYRNYIMSRLRERDSREVVISFPPSFPAFSDFSPFWQVWEVLRCAEREHEYLPLVLFLILSNSPLYHHYCVFIITRSLGTGNYIERERKKEGRNYIERERERERERGGRWSGWREQQRHPHHKSQHAIEHVCYSAFSCKPPGLLCLRAALSQRPVHTCPDALLGINKLRAGRHTIPDSLAQVRWGGRWRVLVMNGTWCGIGC